MQRGLKPMKTLALSIMAAAVLALSMPASAHMRCGAQWPNTDVNANSVFPTFAPSDCMASQLNRQILDNNNTVYAPIPAR
jgi:hypothetical protein